MKLGRAAVRGKATLGMELRFETPNPTSVPRAPARGHGGDAKPSPRGGVEARDFVLAQRGKRIEPGSGSFLAGFPSHVDNPGGRLAAGVRGPGAWRQANSIRRPPRR